jgi:hypothetical protein
LCWDCPNLEFLFFLFSFSDGPIKDTHHKKRKKKKKEKKKLWCPKLGFTNGFVATSKIEC